MHQVNAPGACFQCTTLQEHVTNMHVTNILQEHVHAPGAYTFKICSWNVTPDYSCTMHQGNAPGVCFQCTILQEHVTNIHVTILQEHVHAPRVYTFKTCSWNVTPDYSCTKEMLQEYVSSAQYFRACNIYM